MGVHRKKLAAITLFDWDNKRAFDKPTYPAPMTATFISVVMRLTKKIKYNSL